MLIYAMTWIKGRRTPGPDEPLITIKWAHHSTKNNKFNCILSNWGGYNLKGGMVILHLLTGYQKIQKNHIPLKIAE